ncbi:MAG: type II secretion system protein [Piscirickettsiaceae bacterium]|nr:type II secretion system protein [Piscirickettsiaceae bacterium]
MMTKARGFAYIALLASLAVLMLVLTAASESISQNAKREREQQLFFVGQQFRNAIASYYENSPSGNKQFPKNFDVLLKDNRSIKPARHLRRIYRDPMTNDFLWGEVRNGQQQIIGIYSLSTEQVLITNFNTDLITINEDQTDLFYSDLKFIYSPTEQNKTAKE